MSPEIKSMYLEKLIATLCCNFILGESSIKKLGFIVDTLWRLSGKRHKKFLGCSILMLFCIIQLYACLKTL